VKQFSPCLQRFVIRNADFTSSLLISFWRPKAEPSIEKVRSNDVKKFSGADDLGTLPELRKMSLVARNQVISPGGIGAFNKDIVCGIGTDLGQR